MPDSHEPLSVVVTNFNGRDNLNDFLTRVVAATRELPGIEWIVADDASSDDSVAWLAANLPEVRAVRSPVNRGFPLNANAGFAAARNPYVLLLSSDMVIDPPELEQLRRRMDCFPDALLVSGPQVGPDGTHLAGRFKGEFWRGAVRVRPHPDQPAPGDPGIHHTFQAAVGLYRKALFDDVGGFCPLFSPFFFEEVDLSWRAWKLGFRVLYEPGARIWHYGERGSIMVQVPSRFGRRQHRIHQFYFMWKNIQQPRYWISHLAWLSSRLPMSWLWGDWALYQACWGYLRHRTEIHAKRRELARRARRTDAEVLEVSGLTVPEGEEQGR